MDDHNADVAARGPEMEPEYDNFGTLSEDEAQALHERIVSNVSQDEDNVDNDNTPTIATDEETFAELATAGYPDATTETDEDTAEAERLAKAEAAQAERERAYREKREAFNKKDNAFGFEVAKLLNANLTKLKYGGVKITGAWARDDGTIVITTGGDDTVTIHGYGDEYYQWTVDKAILEHAKRLGHTPTDWAWSHAGKFSACDRCNAMARITDGNEIVAAMYMAACTGKR